MHKCKLLYFILFFLPVAAFAQVSTRTDVLQQAKAESDKEYQQKQQKLIELARLKGWRTSLMLDGGGYSVLAGIDSLGLPLYVATHSNVTAAATIKTTQLWPGGRTGLNLSGSSDNMKSKMGIWDGGLIRTTHVELTGRVVQKDAPTTISDHGTHVAGTLIARGVNPSAKGMSFGLQQLIAYDFSNDNSEMFGEAAKLLVSNHSYGFTAGWRYNETDKRWEYLGEPNSTQDYKFGFYDNQAQVWDSIAYNAPYYLMVKSAGNSRSVNGPAVGQPYWRYDANNVFVNAGTRPEGISSNDGFDIVVGAGNAKNILTIAAAGGIAAGYNRPEDVILTNFTSWGPTDDGRIKPDVVADGSNLLSSWGTADNAYSLQSGTSMSSPNAAGSIFLLQELYSKLNAGTFMRAATLKGLVVHSADEAGPFAGPDYQNGYGLINMERAASLVSSQNTDQLLRENVLANNGVFSLPVVASGKGELIATISWTDPKGTVDFANRLNNPAKKLVNDLDIVVKRGTTIFQPYTLNAAFPTAAATKGDNISDNLEKVVISDVIPGEMYTIEVKHKGTLERGSQAYSLLVSGVGGRAYCTSQPGVNTGARIDSVSLGSFKLATIGGCRAYSNFTSSTANIEANQPLILSIKLGSCDASSEKKVVKAFIDWNNDGDFTDAGETVAQSGAVNGDAIFTTTITTPQNLSPNFFTILRVVVQETDAAENVQPCGAYTKGETQDYRVKVLSPSNDIGIVELVAPEPTACNNKEQLITVRVKNFGPTAQTNIPLNVQVKNGANIVANLTAIYPLPLAAFAEAVYTFQTPVNLSAGTYSITVAASLNTDQNNSNNELVQNVTITAPAPPVAVAEICSPTEAKLRATPSGSDAFFWYDSPTANLPIEGGTFVTTSIIPASKTYYVAKNIRATVGPVNKEVFASGGYNVFTGNYVNIKNEVPVVLESVRLYVGNAGKVNIIVADIISNDATTGSYTYRPLASTLLNVYPTTPNPQPGAVNGNNAADTGAVFYLNLPVSTPGEHVIIVQCQDGATIFRNNNVSPNPYPFSIPGVFSITGNSATQAGDPNFFQNFYYFLYNLKIATAGCESVRVPVVATNALQPVVTLNGTTLTSTTGSNNQWYKDNVGISGATGKTYVATTPGIYKVVNISEFGCILTSNEVNVVVTAVVDVNGTEVGLKLSPNPNKGKFLLNFEVKGKDDLNLSLINATGQKVYQKTYPAFTGRFNKELNVGRQSSGVYTLRIDHNKKIIVKRIIIE